MQYNTVHEGHSLALDLPTVSLGLNQPNQHDYGITLACKAKI
jgi:hypothetical protein